MEYPQCFRGRLVAYTINNDVINIHMREVTLHAIRDTRFHTLRETDCQTQISSVAIAEGAS